MLILNDCDLTVDEITRDIDHNKQYAQVMINNNFDLDMYYNPTQSIVFAIYRDMPQEVTPKATLKQFLGALLACDNYEFQLENYYAPSFDEDPLEMTLEDIHERVGAFQFNVTFPVAV
jgi:hypothetical protein